MVVDLINKSLKISTSMPSSLPIPYIASTLVSLIPHDPGPHPIFDSGPMHPSLAYTDVYVDDFC